MHLLLQALLAFLATYFAWLFHKYVVRAILSPLRQLPGPMSRGLFANHLRYVME